MTRCDKAPTESKIEAQRESRGVKRCALAAGVAFIAIASALFAYRVWPRPLAAKVLHESITLDDSPRRYRLVVPDSLPLGPVPIVFAFHGVGDSPDSMAAYSGLDRLAADRGFVLVYPASRGPMWATMPVDRENLDTNRDVRFFDRLLGRLSDRFTVDRDRIFLVGMSNGASFVQILAHARAEVAAVVAHSGLKPPGLGRATRPFAILLLVGANDSAAEPMRNDAAQYRREGHDAEFLSVPGLGHAWSARHNPTMWEFLVQHKRDW